MTKSGGTIPPLQILGGFVPPCPPVIYAHDATPLHYWSKTPIELAENTCYDPLYSVAYRT